MNKFTNSDEVEYAYPNHRIYFREGKSSAAKSRDAGEVVQGEEPEPE